MKNNRNTKYIYITPFLSEIQRVLEEIPDFKEPRHLGEGKLENLHDLLVNDYNIATTHALFKTCTEETIDLINAGEYTLILDESMDVVDMFDITNKDYDLLIKNKVIQINSDKIVNWLDDEYEGQFDYFKRLCKNGTVIEIKQTKKIQFLAWNFSTNAFNAFKDIYILTYLFESSMMQHYFKMNKIQYDKYTIQDYNMIPFDTKKPYDKTKYKKLINIYEGNLNNIGDRKTALSLNWLRKKSKLRDKLKNNIYNYFQHQVNAVSDTIIWTTFKNIQKHLKGKGYTKGFLACNARATNEYKHTYNLAYCCNRFISPDYIKYFELRGVIIDEELYALSEMLQWIWRSRIREGKPINIYIPSRRQRNLLIRWLNNKNI
ncbi:hypothetical protein [Schnuerera sp.]|uniref:hypothetical protein n=1 Tax=Schnuerera sp. TaxID=2794844 RepID=UPI002C77FEE3|nr:hypothetical protein [Schnuerera sp.]HSH36618.1 hypothetical protein [Schnuerera sp.]